MRHINLYRSLKPIRFPVRGCYVRFDGLDIEKKADRRAFLQSVVNGLSRKGYDAAVAPKKLSNSFDLVLLNSNGGEAENALKRYSRLGPRVIEATVSERAVVEKAWQNKVRVYLMGKGFLKIGDRYILKRDIADRTNYFKSAFRIQAVLAGDYPALLVDPRTRIMIPLIDGQIERADELGEESKEVVRVLPRWQRGILVGRAGRKAEDMEFPFGDRTYRTPDYWRVKHGIDFVAPSDEMLEVYVAAFERVLPYPRSCVFSEFPSGMPLPSELRMSPDTRVKKARLFIQKYLTSISFLGQRVTLQGPYTLSDLGYVEHTYPPQREFRVVVGNGQIATVNGLHGALRRYGPYAGRIDGRYVVIHHRDQDKVIRALKMIERTYRLLNLGELRPVGRVGNNGLVDTGGESVTDYTSAIAELRLELDSQDEKVIAIVVLPDSHASEIYYKSKEKLFERIFGLEHLPTQAVSMDTLAAIANGGRTAYPTSVTIASQCYVKLGGTGAAVWILHEPADTPIPGIPPGSSCYAYHDVSRRPKIKASATAYSALTDSYGRYIATGTKPIGGEKLTPSGFYDILVELLQKSSVFSRRYATVGERKFSFQRLVFAKDGVIRNDEADMMEEVIFDGLPEERKEPIPSLLSEIKMLPDSLVIDIIDVNKSPNKRLFDRDGGKFLNVPEGTAICYDDSKGLLVSCRPETGTAQPLEISLKKHICLNRDDAPTPHISQIMEEYYRLTFLDWASIFKQGKYALPQILTQNLGKHISAGVLVPDDMILL